MCGPVDDEKLKPEQEEFLEEFESALFETFREGNIFSASAPEPIFDGDKLGIPVSGQANGNGKSKNAKAIRRIH